jgi:hypothetical protein
MPLVGAASRRHASLQCGSGAALRFRERCIETLVAVLGGPVIFVVAVGLVNRILRLVAARIDKCERLAGQTGPLNLTIAVWSGEFVKQSTGRNVRESSSRIDPPGNATPFVRL